MLGVHKLGLGYEISARGSSLICACCKMFVCCVAKGRTTPTCIMQKTATLSQSCLYLENGSFKESFSIFRLGSSLICACCKMYVLCCKGGGGMSHAYIQKSAPWRRDFYFQIIRSRSRVTKSRWLTLSESCLYLENDSLKEPISIFRLFYHVVG